MTLIAGPPAAQAQFNGSFAIDRLKLNRENWLDWRAYQPPLSWRKDAYRAPNAMQATVGSLSQVRFYQADDLRLEADLGANATFLYAQTEDALFRGDPFYQEVEMRFGWEGLYASIVGFPRPDKSQGNQGAALAWGKRTDPVTVRYTYLQEQALFNEKTSTADRYREAPVLHRLQARHAAGEQVQGQVDYRYEPRAELVSPDLAQRQTYAAENVDAWGEWRVREGLALGVVLSANGERRQQLPDTPGAAAPELTQALTWGWTEANAQWALAGGDLLTLAVVQSQFENRITSSDPAAGFHFRLRTTQGYGLWEWVRGPWLRWTFSLQVGEVRLFKAGAADAADRNDRPSLLGKAGLGVILAQAGRYRFWFQSTWAPDAISGQKWDGGNVQFQLLF